MRIQAASSWQARISCTTGYGGSGWDGLQQAADGEELIASQAAGCAVNLRTTLEKIMLRAGH